MGTVGAAIELLAGIAVIGIIFAAIQPAMDVIGAYNMAIGGKAASTYQFLDYQETFVIILAAIAILLAYILPILGIEDASTLYRIAGSVARQSSAKQPKRGKSK